jgi:tetratricopeptide (TPR) repeat protein
LFLAADSARRSNNLPLASDRLAAAAAIDSMPAKLYFAMGQCLEGREDYSAAHRAYSRARDLDGLRFRASGDLNAVIRSFAKEPGVFIADNESTFAAASPDGIVGNNLLFEHVHPLAQGYFLIAKTFGETMRDSALIFSPPEWANHPWPGDDSLWALAAVTPLDEKMAEFRIAVLKSGWPFRESRGELPSFHPQDEMERLASEVAMRRLDWRNAHLQYGEILARANNLAAATPEFYAVAKVTPENEWPWMRLGDLYGLQENYAQAERAYRQALAIRPTAAIELKLGSLYLTMDNSQAAVAPLERAINATAPALAPGELAVAHYFLAAALANCGQLQRALQEIALAGQLAPDNPDIKLLQKQLEE